jgi:hypothetical protein
MSDAKSVISRHWINISNIISNIVSQISYLKASSLVIIHHLESQYLRSKGKKDQYLAVT